MYLYLTSHLTWVFHFSATLYYILEANINSFSYSSTFVGKLATCWFADSYYSVLNRLLLLMCNQSDAKGAQGNS